jgi:hypothetical protein
VTPGSPNPFDPLLLETSGVIRGTPSWKEVKEAMGRLADLRKAEAKPYEQMDLDRVRVLGYAARLQNSAKSIAYAICLATHLARFSKTPDFAQRLNEGFRGLSTGLDLLGLDEVETANELERCVRAAFPNLTIEIPPLQAPVPAPQAGNPPPTAPEAAPQAALALPEAGNPSPVAPEAAPEAALAQPESSVVGANNEPDGTVPDQHAEPSNAPPVPAPQPAAASEAAPLNNPPAAENAPPPQTAGDTWKSAVERALADIRSMGPINFDEVMQRASNAWQNRLVAFLTGQPEVPPDIDYLRCRVANSPLGMVSQASLRGVGLQEWSRAYVAGMLETGVPFPVPLWFSLAALRALGFDVPPDLSSVKSAEEANAAAEFVARISQTSSPQKGLLILRVTAQSQTANWKISPTTPALILDPADFLKDGKMNLQSYFQPRLHGILIEVGRDEQPAAALTRVGGVAAITQRIPLVRVGLLLASPAQNTSADFPAAVMPNDPNDAYVKAFTTHSPAPPPPPPR